MPHREGHVLDAVANLGAAGFSQLRGSEFCSIESHHAFEVGDRNEQRTIGVAVSQHGVDLEHWMGWIAVVDADAVVDDSFEDRQCPHAHATMLADG